MDRDTMIKKLESGSGSAWDVIVTGGGATGSGIALDAVTRGYNTILFEQADFASGTSSRSTKLVHGGVRYLAQGDIFLVIEALRERGRILRNASHLTYNQKFIIPAYTWWDVILYTAGLKFYDLLSGSLSLGKSYFISRKETLECLPLLRAEGLKGGIEYHDGQFDDSRLAFTLVNSAAERGGVILNYFKVVDFLKDEGEKISGVIAEDLISGISYKIRSKLVINATGVFADSLLRIDDPSARATIRPSQGIHLVLDSSFLQGHSAVMIPKTDDGRVLFAIPWYGKVVVGTTDTPLDEVSMEPEAKDDEIDFILRTAGKYLKRKPERSDVLTIFAGLRPLAANQGNNQSTKEISRRHKITISKSGLLTITGGKWTTYRCMAEETINRAIKERILVKKKCVTRDYPLCPGNYKPSAEHFKIYGENAMHIEKMIQDDPSSGEKLHRSFPYTRAEILWIIRNEMPCTLGDILARRTRALFLDARASINMAPVVAGIMASERGKDNEWADRQVTEYIKSAGKYLRYEQKMKDK